MPPPPKYATAHLRISFLEAGEKFANGGVKLIPVHAEKNDEVEEEDDFVICRSHLRRLVALFHTCAALRRTGNKAELRRNTGREPRLCQTSFGKRFHRQRGVEDNMEVLKKSRSFSRVPSSRRYEQRRAEMSGFVPNRSRHVERREDQATPRDEPYEMEISRTRRLQRSLEDEAPLESPLGARRLGGNPKKVRALQRNG